MVVDFGKIDSVGLLSTFPTKIIDKPLKMSIYPKNKQEKAMKNGIPELLDPNLLKAAKEIYHTYCYFHIKLNKPPIGVAIDRKTHRGQLLFTKRPILLPWENFIPIHQIESEN